jgi:hypothetical protein
MGVLNKLSARTPPPPLPYPAEKANLLTSNLKIDGLGMEFEDIDGVQRKADILREGVAGGSPV